MDTVDTTGNVLIPLTLFLSAIAFMAFLTLMSPHIHRYRLNRKIKREAATVVHFPSYDPAAALDLFFYNPVAERRMSIRDHLITTLGMTARDHRGFDRGASFHRHAGYAMVAEMIRQGFIPGAVDEDTKYVEWNTEDYDELLIKMVEKA
jgi:hypothetical protein